MLQSALNRLQYWQDQLQAATSANDAARVRDCARFIEEYGLLIKQMGDRLDGDDAKPK
jgi:hypothetical protein